MHNDYVKLFVQFLKDQPNVLFKTSEFLNSAQIDTHVVQFGKTRSFQFELMSF